MSMKNHPFDLVEYNPSPLLSSFSILTTMTGMAKWFHLWSWDLFLLGLPITSLIAIQWWRDIIRESTHQGIHTLKVTLSMKWGTVLFIISEIF